MAKDLYIGSYFNCNLKWAMSVAKISDILILSAKHGLLKLTDTVDPYDLKMGSKGSIHVDLLRYQAQILGIVSEKVYAIGLKDYTEILREVFPNLILPVKGLSIGCSMQVLNKNHGRLPK